MHRNRDPWLLGYSDSVGNKKKCHCSHFVTVSVGFYKQMVWEIPKLPLDTLTGVNREALYMKTNLRDYKQDHRYKKCALNE